MLPFTLYSPSYLMDEDSIFTSTWTESCSIIIIIGFFFKSQNCPWAYKLEVPQWIKILVILYMHRDDFNLGLWFLLERRISEQLQHKTLFGSVLHMSPVFLLSFFFPLSKKGCLRWVLTIGGHLSAKSTLSRGWSYAKRSYYMSHIRIEPLILLKSF